MSFIHSTYCPFAYVGKYTVSSKIKHEAYVTNEAYVRTEDSKTL